MADMWNDFPSEPGQLAGLVAQQVAALAPIQPQSAAQHDAGSDPMARPRPYRDSLAWSAIKSLVQLALVVSVLIFVVDGGNAPLMALCYVGTGLLLMGAIVVADRERFTDRDPGFQIIEYVQPPRAAQQSAASVPMATRAPLVPLAQQMHVAMPERVSVT